MENENTEGKVSNTCVYINLKNHFGIQEINFLLLLQDFSMVILAEGFVSLELYVVFIVLCCKKYERHEQLCVGAGKSK